VQFAHESPDDVWELDEKLPVTRQALRMLWKFKNDIQNKKVKSNDDHKF